VAAAFPTRASSEVARTDPATPNFLHKLTVFSCGATGAFDHLRISGIDQSTAIVAESARNSECADFPLKSKAKKFDGSAVGF
jgi:hypothetical protein